MGFPHKTVDDRASGMVKQSSGDGVVELAVYLYEAWFFTHFYLMALEFDNKFYNTTQIVCAQPLRLF